MASCYESVANRWESIKPTFLRLYIDEDKTLDEVRSELWRIHKFKASQSAFTRQIRKWNAFKNYKKLDKQQLASQRSRGEQPKADQQGRPIKWDRVYRGTRVKGVHKRRQRGDGDTPSSVEHKAQMAVVPQPLLSQPVNRDNHALSFVVDIWRHSTFKFASKDPSIPSYRVERTLYERLMQSMDTIVQSPKFEWPRSEIDNVCNTIPLLVRQQPAMVCDLLTFLTTHEWPESLGVCKSLKDQLFGYIRSMSFAVLPRSSSLWRFISLLPDRKALSNLGAAIAKVKLDMMWNNQVIHDGKSQHHRPFFRHVIIRAILVVIEFGDLEFAAGFLRKLAIYHDNKDPLYLTACKHLSEIQGTSATLMSRTDEAGTFGMPLHSSKVESLEHESKPTTCQQDVNT